MKMEHTRRGFTFTKFIDSGNNECSLQESSCATENRIWLGCTKINLKYFNANQGGWVDITEPDTVNTVEEHYYANNHMHLNQEQVRNLLPLLTHFAEHGTLPE